MPRSPCLFIIQFSRMYNNFETKQEHQASALSITALSQNNFYEFFRVSCANQHYITKAFPSNKIDQYQKELWLLQALQHPNIVKPLSPGHQILEKLGTQFKGKIMVLAEAKYGDLMQYVVRFGGFTQKITKFYLKKIVETLIYAQNKTGGSHPNLTIANILMKDNRDILLCGWSNSLQTVKHQPLMEIAQLAIQLVTGRNPFSSKDIQKSQFSKFLNTKLIGKFWEQIQKSACKRSKNFVLSEEFKKVVSLMLLGKLKTFEEIESLYLNEEEMTLEQVQQQLQNHQKMVAQRRAMQLNKL